MEISSQLLNLLWSVSTALRLQPTEGEGSTLCGLLSGFLGRKILLQEENLYKLCRVDKWSSAGGDFASTPGDIWQCLKTFLVATTRGRVLLVWAGVLLNILQYTGTHPPTPVQQRIIWPKMSIRPRLRACGRLRKEKMCALSVCGQKLGPLVTCFAEG